ncbi:MAG TPA: AAA family ATPase, partial [Bacteroidia bacterium]|nr:AAA family ATPase [Bacteroidia bacterium]
VSAKDRIQNLPQTEEKLQQINRSIYLYTKLYDFLIQKRAEAMVEAPVLPPSSYILNEAKMPTAPISPNAAKVWSLALLVSLLFGALITAVKPLLKIKISNRKDLQKFTDIPFIANIEAGGKNHDFIESFMTLCTKILMLGNKQPVKMITITSAKAGEGKTTVAENLAKSMGKLRKKVLLIDMNPINPSLKNTLGNEEENSLAQVIDDDKNLHQAVQITNYENVDLLCAGYLAHGVNTLLINDKTGNILADMKTLYDYVIFDTPETSNYMDAVPLMKMSDLNMFVVKANSTTFDQLEYASQMKKDFQVENLFMIINGMTDTMNHSGMQTSGKVKQIRRREQAEAEIRLMPRIMKKAALWFY